MHTETSLRLALGLGTVVWRGRGWGRWRCVCCGCDGCLSSPGCRAGETSEEGAVLSVVHERTRSLPLTGEERAVAGARAGVGAPRLAEPPRGLTNGCKRWQKAFTTSRRASTGCRMASVGQPFPRTYPHAHVEDYLYMKTNTERSLQGTADQLKALCMLQIN